MCCKKYNKINFYYMESDNDSISIESDEEIKNIPIETNYNNFIEQKYKINLLEKEKNFEINKNNSLYDNIILFSRCIKSIYYILFNLKLLNKDFGDNCLCCDNNNFNIQSFIDVKDISNLYIPDKTKIYLYIKKFMNLIDILPCFCKFKNNENINHFIKINFMNFDKYYVAFNDYIINLNTLLTDFYNINNSKKLSIKLLNTERCIHEDIRYNSKNYCYKNIVENYDKIIIFVKQLNEIVNFTQKNIIDIVELFSIQSVYYFNKSITKSKVLSYFKKIYISQLPIININHKQNNKYFFNILLENKINNDIIKQIIDLVININNSHIIQYIKETIEYKNYEICIYLFNYININHDIEEFINIILSSKNISPKLKYEFINTLYKNNIKNNNFLNTILLLEDGDLIITYFDNHICFNENNIELLVDNCIIHNKPNMLQYILKNYNVDNAYKNYFSNIKNENINLFNIISNFNYDIHIKINSSHNNFINGKECLLYHCIQKNFTNIGIILIKNSITLNNLYNNKSLLVLSILSKNYKLALEILKKNNKIHTINYNNLTPTSILLNNFDFENYKYLELLLELLKYNTNFNDSYNVHFGFKIIDANIHKNYKLIIFNHYKNTIDPLIVYNNIPLIIYSVINNEIEITNLLWNNLLSKNKLRFNNSYYELIDNNNINYICLLHKFINDITINITLYDLLCIDIIIFILLITIYLLNINKKENTIINNEEINDNNFFSEIITETLDTNSFNNNELIETVDELTETIDDNIWIKSNNNHDELMIDDIVFSSINNL